VKHRNRTSLMLSVAAAVSACAVFSAFAAAASPAGTSPVPRGEAKNERPFTRPATAAKRRLDAAGVSSASVVASQGEAKNEWPFTRPTTTAADRLDTAAPSFLAEVRAKLSGRWADAWQTLYPMHQEVAPLSTYVACEQSTGFAVEPTAVFVEQVRKADVAVPGLARRIPGVALWVRATFPSGSHDPIVVDHVFHLVPFAGSWRWLLSRAEYMAFSAGTCLS